jgi:hypothetical protein
MSDLSFGKIIIDKTISEAFLVRKKNDTGDVLIVDTTDYYNWNYIESYKFNRWLFEYSR